MQHVERKIVFYRARLPLGDDGRPRLPEWPAVLREIDQLPFEPHGRYLEDERTGEGTCAWPAADEPLPSLLVGAIRRNELPQLDDSGGNLTALQIPPRAGLVEGTHVVFFDDGIVGADSNFYGPRLSRLAYYLRVRVPRLCEQLGLDPLLRRDALHELDRFGAIRLMKLKVRADYVQQLREADENVFDALEAAKEFSGAEMLELTVRGGPRSKKTLFESVKTFVTRVLRRDDYREGIGLLRVKGVLADRDDVLEVDLLRDRLVVTKNIATAGPRTKHVDSPAAYRAIREAYTEVRDELAGARGAEQL
jgi:hypothetical protein